MNNKTVKISDNLVKDVNKRVFYYFRRISQIPRGSGNEQAIADWLVDFAKLYGFKYTRSPADEYVNGKKTNNVVIFKPATLGYEHCKPVIIQGHMDMVCTKTADSTHDFLKDPIKIMEYVDKAGNNIMTADRTTLGADNGIGCAYALAILERDDIPHPEINALFTSDEEAGMSGAIAVNAELLGGVENKCLVNVDTEEEGSLYNACAGGLYANFEVEIENMEAISSALSVIEIEISGLRGGHSGVDIHRGRANAYILMMKILQEIGGSGSDMRLVNITGGKMTNAIAMQSTAVIAVKKNLGEIQEIVAKHRANFDNEFKGIEPLENVVMVARKPDKEWEYAVPINETNVFVNTVLAIPNGVIEMYPDDSPNAGLVKTSTSIGYVEQEPKRILFTSFIRSFIDTEKPKIANQMKNSAQIFGANVSTSGDSPGWAPNPDSELVKRFVSAYQFIFGVTPEIKSIHAGLECGFFAKKFPDMDIISCGPTLVDVHTPDEIMYMDTVIKVTELLLVALWQMKGSVAKEISDDAFYQ